MIEVEADILRGSCMPVFFVGETIECEIKFRCSSLKSESLLNKKKRLELETQQSHIKKNDQFLLENDFEKVNLNDVPNTMFSMLSNIPSSSSITSNLSLPGTPSSSSSVNNFLSAFKSSKSNDNLENNEEQQVILWSCAQIDCHCYIDESKVILSSLRYNNTNENKDNETSFQPNKDRVGISVYSSKPKILFCNLSLRPNESKSFIFKETLPYDLAPTFRGQFAKYSYKLTIGIQKLNSTTQLLRLPFRVYSLLEFEKFIPKLGPEYNEDSSKDGIITITDSVGDSDSFDEDLSPNPFEIVEKSEYENLEYALQILEDLSARMNTSTYNVTIPDGNITKITINKTNYKIGDKLVVFLDFTDSQVPCVEFKVTLQSEEIISEECRKKTNQVQPGINSLIEIKESSLFVKKTDVTLQIPVHITPTFVTDIISLRWRLHFDFALSKTQIQKIQKSNDPAMSVSWRPPDNLTVEVISWDLPIVIHPFDPFIASDVIYCSSNNSNPALKQQNIEPNRIVLK